MRALGVLTMAISLLCGPAAAQILLRSDLPLWTDPSAEGFWPRSFSDSESFGCLSKFRLGDFEFRPHQEADSDARADSPKALWRMENYGVFHCAYVLRRGSGSNVETAPWSYAWVVELGEERMAAQTLELLAFQIGASGGSEYVVVSQPSGGDWSQLAVLDLQCPRGALRDAGSIDIWATGYCAVESKAALRRMARSAASRPPVGRLVRLTPP